MESSEIISTISENALCVAYLANVIVAGVVGYYSLFAARTAAQKIFEGMAEASSVMKITGSFWLAIAVLSAVGIFYPLQMSVILLVQFVYKGLWLTTVAAPALIRAERRPIPLGVAAFFLVWVIVLPFVIPFRHIFRVIADR